MKYAFIQAHRPQYRLTRLCEVLGVPPSGYYDWRDRPESTRACENRRLTEKIRHYHRLSRGRYGSPKYTRTWSTITSPAASIVWRA